MLRKKFMAFIKDTNGMEFIDVAVIVAGSILVLYAMYEIIYAINKNVESSEMGILKKK